MENDQNICERIFRFYMEKEIDWGTKLVISIFNNETPMRCRCVGRNPIRPIHCSVPHLPLLLRDAQHSIAPPFKGITRP